MFFLDALHCFVKPSELLFVKTVLEAETVAGAFIVYFFVYLFQLNGFENLVPLCTKMTNFY